MSYHLHRVYDPRRCISTPRYGVHNTHKFEITSLPPASLPLQLRLADKPRFGKGGPTESYRC